MAMLVEEIDAREGQTQDASCGLIGLAAVSASASFCTLGMMQGARGSAVLKFTQAPPRGHQHKE